MARKPGFLARLIRRLFVLLALVAIILAFMYSERIARYPWRWDRADVSGFFDYCLMKYDEAREGTELLIARFENSELRDKLDGLYDKLNAKLRRSREQDAPQSAASDAGDRDTDTQADRDHTDRVDAPLEPRDRVEPRSPVTSPVVEGPGPVEAPTVDTRVPATPAPAAPAPAAPELSEAEQLWLQGYELKQRGHQASGRDAEELFLQAVKVWKGEAVPALEREIEAAEQHGQGDRAQELEELYQSLNVLLHDLFKDRPM